MFSILNCADGGVMKRKDNKVVIEVDSKNHQVNARLVVLIILLLLVIAVMIFILQKKKSQQSVTDVASDVVEEVQEAVTEFVDEQIIGEEGEVNTITESEIMDVFEIAKLETADYIYNAVVHVNTSDGSAVKYHVAYQGTVTAGIKFDEIVISVDNEQKIIYITMPPVTILDTVVDSGKLKYIFEDDKYDNETVFVKLGVDMSKVKIDVDGTDITISIPEAEIISIKADEASFKDPICASDNYLKSLTNYVIILLLNYRPMRL